MDFTKEMVFYFMLFVRNFKNNLGEFEEFLDKSKMVTHIYGDMTKNKRGIISKESSILPIINNVEKSSFLSNSVLNSKIVSRIDRSVESK